MGYQQTSTIEKYLGVPLITGRVSSNTYKHIQGRIQSKLAAWKRQSLSLAGRITLAKSVLSNIPFYTMQSTLLPSNCCNEIEKIIRKFIWGHSEGQRGVNLVKWSDLCQPPKNGGCGLLRLEPQNKAFLSKLIYKIYKQPEALWVRVLRGKYGFQRGIDEWNGTRCSHFWRNIIKIWEEASFHIKWTPGDGRRIRFWSEFWIGDYGPLKNIAFSPIPQNEIHRPIHDFLDENGNWKRDMFEHLLPNDVLTAILDTTITKEHMEPTCFWNLTKEGEFTTKSFYRANESINWTNAESKWTKVWKLPIAQRIRTFSWLLLKGKLLTNSERQRRGMTDDARCSLCFGGIEDINHVFKYCPIASAVWKKVLPTDICSDFFHTDVTSWLVSMLMSSIMDNSWRIGLFTLCWKLWDVRNHRLFQHCEYTVESILAQVRPIIKHTMNSFISTHTSL